MVDDRQPTEAEREEDAMKSTRYSFKDTLKENAGLSVYNTGYEKCDSGKGWGPALRDHYLIHLVSAGRGEFVYNKQSHALQTGDLFLIFPGQLVSYQADAQDPWEYCWVGFNGTDARRLVSMAGFTRREPVLHCSDSAGLRDRLLRIAEVSGNTAADDAAMAGCLYLFLAELIRLNDRRTGGDPHQAYVANALRFIQYNYAGDIGVSDIARYVGISRSQLYRAFLQDFSLSPHTYLQKYRINEACSLLRRPEFSIAEVAGSVGFNDPLYFSRVFKSIKHCTPSEYQREALQASGSAPPAPENR